MQNKKIKLFQSKEEELSILRNDDNQFTNTKKYLDNLILSALTKFELPQYEFNRLYKEIMNDIPIAAKRFLANEKNKKNYKFSTYFTWYIAERINKVENLRRKNNVDN